MVVLLCDPATEIPSHLSLYYSNESLRTCKQCNTIDTLPNIESINTLDEIRNLLQRNKDADKNGIKNAQPTSIALLFSFA